MNFETHHCFQNSKFKINTPSIPLLLQNQPLSQYCTFNVGGPAEFFYQAKSKQDLHDILVYAVENHLPYFVFGAGSNLLFPDEGMKGVVIKNLAHKITIHDEKVVAESGAILAQILVESLKHNLVGLEELIGLPGTIGGAVRGNAGAYHTEIKDALDKIEVFIPPDSIKTFSRDELEFSYRHSTFKLHPDWVILEVSLKLTQGATDKAQETIKNILKNRKGKQPGGHNTGSFFKNPSKEKPAGWLIEQAGLRGTRIGDAQISDVHANFFMNLGHATATDILALAALAKEKVKQKFGVELEEEVVIV